LFLFRVPIPLLTIEAAGLLVELAELGVVGFDTLLPAPSSMGRTVCLEELLDVSLGSAVIVGDGVTGRGMSPELLPVSGLGCEEAATAALFLHM
jgi:hypothetical protein